MIGPSRSGSTGPLHPWPCRWWCTSTAAVGWWAASPPRTHFVGGSSMRSRVCWCRWLTASPPNIRSPPRRRTPWLLSSGHGGTPAPSMVTPSTLVVLGDSAGATWPQWPYGVSSNPWLDIVSRQILAYPGVGAERGARATPYGSEWPLTEDDRTWFFDQYVPDETKRSDPRCGSGTGRRVGDAAHDSPVGRVRPGPQRRSRLRREAVDGWRLGRSSPLRRTDPRFPDSSTRRSCPAAGRHSGSSPTPSRYL